MEVVGYCTIKIDATTGVGVDVPSFLGKDVRVMEFAADGGALCVNSNGDAMAMFDKEDIIRRFECSLLGEVVCPPNMGLMDQVAYSAKVNLRKGGYNNLLRQMVIQASLMKGELNDRFLFQKQ